VAGRRRRLGSSGVAQAIEAALRAEASPERAEDERRYLKSALTHLGASVPTIRRVAREEWKARGGLARTELLAAVESLWSSGIHECRMAAIELLELGLPVLEARDIRLLERLLRESRTWALVDGLAASVVGPLVEREPALDATLDRWAEDDDFWIRRSALLAHLLALRRGDGDFPRFARYADAMLDEREFFIRKAIGWVLRETGKKRPRARLRLAGATRGAGIRRDRPGGGQVASRRTASADPVAARVTTRARPSR
jgi:3-methyladenine DNA glycosylase AlkD